MYDDRTRDVQMCKHGDRETLAPVYSTLSSHLAAVLDAKPTGGSAQDHLRYCRSLLALVHTATKFAYGTR